MGIFSFSKQKKVEVKNLIWLNHSAKLEGVKKFVKDNNQVVLVAWFTNTYEIFDKFLNVENGLNLEIIMARNLRSNQSANKNLVFLEHYPLLSKEDELLKNLEPSKVYYLNSLDEPIFNIFGGERIIEMMKNLGMKEDEVIEHPMITKSIEQAQKKVENKVTVENSANSQKEWFERNF